MESLEPFFGFFLPHYTLRLKPPHQLFCRHSSTDCFPEQLLPLGNSMFFGGGDTKPTASPAKTLALLLRQRALDRRARPVLFQEGLHSCSANSRKVSMHLLASSYRRVLPSSLAGCFSGTQPRRMGQALGDLPKVTPLYHWTARTTSVSSP